MLGLTGSQRGLGCPWSGQPDRRAHRLQRRLRHAVRPRAAGTDRRRSARMTAPGASRRSTIDSTETFRAADLQPGMTGWQAYVAGVVWALEEAGHRIGGADLVLTSDVPVGAGLSSSAALECAVLTALADLNDLDIAGLERAKLARRAENAFVGAPTGLMDQAASTLCTAGHALFFDCRTDDSRAGSIRHGQRRPGDPGPGHQDTACAGRQRIRCPPSQLRGGRPAARRGGVAGRHRPGRRAGPASRSGDPAPGTPCGHRERSRAGGRRGAASGPHRRSGAAPRRLACLDAGRLRDHGAAGRPRRRDGSRLRSPRRSDDRRRLRRLHHRAGPGRGRRSGSETRSLGSFADAGYGPPAHFAAVPSAGAQRLQ